MTALALQRKRPAAREPFPGVPLWSLAIAALLAFTAAVAVLPKLTSEGVALAAPIFDHAKVAMIDEMARLGVPPGNPFFGELGAPQRLAYYYLWHFSAAELVLLTGMTGWEADVGLTWFTAFASLALMMGIATWLSGRASAAVWVLALSLAGSLRSALDVIFDALDLDGDSLIPPATGFGGWEFQAAWVPQHLASVSCVLLAVVLMSRMVERRNVLLLATCVLVVVAAFESSAWVGGVTLAAVAVTAGLILLVSAAPSQRLPFLLSGAAVAALALLLAAPLLRDQLAATALSEGSSPIGVSPVLALGTRFSNNAWHWPDLPAYWIVHLPVEFPAIYPAGVLAMVGFLAARHLDPDRRRAALGLAAMAMASLFVAWLLVSKLAFNNDLGWRAALTAAIALIVFTAIGFSHWLAAPKRLAAVVAIAMLLLGLFEGVQIAQQNLTGDVDTFSKVFASSPSMWDAVRRHSAPDERVANNPLFLKDATPWPVNLSWAVLSNRRSCFAGRELALVYARLSRERREEIDAQFIRVFEGKGSADDVRDLAVQFECRLIVVAAQDGAWTRDPFAASPYYRLVESKPEAWRIYKGGAVGMAQAP